MHGHLAFYGAYAMIVLAVITYSLPFITGNPDAEQRHGGIGLWAFWLQVAGMTGITMAFAAAGVAQVYMERILGIGYLDAQAKIQVHIQMLLAAAFIFTLGVFLFLWEPGARGRERVAGSAWPGARRGRGANAFARRPVQRGDGRQ